MMLTDADPQCIRICHARATNVTNGTNGRTTSLLTLRKKLTLGNARETQIIAAALKNGRQ